MGHYSDTEKIIWTGSYVYIHIINIIVSAVHTVLIRSESDIVAV